MSEGNDDCRVDSLAIDSGAFSLYMKEVYSGGERVGDYSYYETDEFWEYVDEYCRWLKDGNADLIDFYVDVDVIYNPELSWKVQKYMEDEYGLSPVPVFHYGEDLKWLKRYVKAGYDLIGVNGIIAGVTVEAYYAWADEVFNYLCPKPKRLPVVRVHGFAMTAYELMLRYPWWSVDSATWVKAGAWGSIFVPHKRNGKWDFSEKPYQIGMSDRCPKQKRKGAHYFNLAPKEKKIVEEWLEEIGIPVGEDDSEQGCCNYHAPRKTANLLFFERMEQWMPEWPCPLRIAYRKPLIQVL